MRHLLKVGASQRPNIIDIEASGLGRGGYPIEVGVVLSSGNTYCALIAPAPEWEYWDADAEQVHGISKDVLRQHGKPIQQVAEELNAFIAEQTVYSDGWVVDKPWMLQLFQQSRVKPRFRLSALEILLKEPQMQIWSEIKSQVINDLSLKRHRASADALIIQETFVRTRLITSQKTMF